MGAKVLIIDDEIEIRRLLKVGLAAHGFDSVEAATAKEGIYEAVTARPDVIILDMGLPDQSGLEVLKQIREWSRVPVIVLSVRGQERDKVGALDVGADDYLTKPFSISELMARIRVALRHQANQKDEPIIQIDDLHIDLSRRLVKIGATEIHLTPIEYDLLKILASNAGKVITHYQLINSVWGTEGEDRSQYLRIYISQLRKKIETDPSQPNLVLTEPGVGYRLNAKA